MTSTVTYRPLQGRSVEAYRTATGAEATRTHIWEGSVRSSKTVGSILAWINAIRTLPAGPLLMVGKTERTLYRNVIDPMTTMLGVRRCRYIAGSGQLIVCGRTVSVVGANDTKAQDKIRGMSLVGAYVDEISILPESFWQMLMSRLSIPGNRLYGTTNPDSKNHWLYTDWLQRARHHHTRDGAVLTTPDDPVDDPDNDGPLNLTRYTFGLDDNPFLEPEFVSELKRQYTGLWYRRFILGEWCVAEGAIYADWDPDRHVIPNATADDLPIDRVIGVGIDYGTTNPTAGVHLALTAEPTPRLLIAHEWAPPRGAADSVLVTDYLAWLARLPAHHRQVPWHVVDPAAPSLRVEMRTRGLTGVLSGTNAVVDGIRTVSSLLATDRIVYAERCTNLRRETPDYVWDSEATGRGEDAPVKDGDHWLDAKRYGIHTLTRMWRGKIKTIGSLEAA